MENILQIAETLGKAIAESPQVQTMKQARDALQKEPDIEQTLKAFHEQADKMNRMEQQNQPIEVEEKRKLRDLQTKLAGSATFKTFTEAQMEYVDLMRKVNETMRRHLAKAVEPGDQI